MAQTIEAARVAESRVQHVRELLAQHNIFYMEGAEEMSDEELSVRIASLIQSRRDDLAAGRPRVPASVCAVCFRPHQAHARACDI